MFRRLVGTPFLEERICEVVAGVWKIGAELERAPIGGDGRIDLTARTEGSTEVVVSRRVAGLQLDSPLVVCNRFIDAAVRLQRGAEILFRDGAIHSRRQQRPVRKYRNRAEG